MNRRIAAGLALAAALVAGRAGAAEEPLRVAHRVTATGESFQVAAEGLARLPDGAILQVRLVPYGEGGETGDALRVTRVGVRDGRFTLPPWDIPRVEVKAFEYQLVVHPAGEQPEEALRGMSRLARRWKASSRFALGDWRSIGSRVARVAQALRERVLALARHRAELHRMTMAACENRLGRSEWTSWRTRSGFDRAREACFQALDAPLVVVTFPLARGRAYGVISQYDFAADGVDKLLRAAPGTTDDSVTEFVADYKVSPFAVSTEDHLGLDAVFAFEGARHFVIAVDEVSKGLDPGAKPTAGARPPPPLAARADASLKALGEILGWSRDFFAVEWSGSVQETQDGLLRAIDAARRLAEASARPPAAGEEASAEASRSLIWKELRGMIDALREDLRRKLGA